MHPHLTVHCDQHEKPIVHVPGEFLWELVEFLSFHRVLVSYYFARDDFYVTFEHRGEESVRNFWKNGSTILQWILPEFKP